VQLGCLRTQPNQKDSGSGDHDGLHQKGAARALPACGRRGYDVRAGQRIAGGGCSPHGDGEEAFASEEEVTVTGIGDGGELGRRNDGGRQGAARCGRARECMMQVQRGGRELGLDLK
jgi:hypothetical protein